MDGEQSPHGANAHTYSVRDCLAGEFPAGQREGVKRNGNRLRALLRAQSGAVPRALGVFEGAPKRGVFGGRLQAQVCECAWATCVPHGSVAGEKGILRRDVLYPARAVTANGTNEAAADIIREAVTNAVRHALATRIDIQSWLAADGHHLMITDNGTPHFVKFAEGSGIGGMRAKAEALGGSLQVVPSPRFTIYVLFPGGENE